MKRVTMLIRPNAKVSETEQRLSCQRFAREHGLSICMEYAANDDYVFDFVARLPDDPIMCIKTEVQAGLCAGLLVFRRSFIGRDDLETPLAINWFHRHGTDIYCAKDTSEQQSHRTV